jgi:hypothetical protein
MVSPGRRLVDLRVNVEVLRSRGALTIGFAWSEFGPTVIETAFAVPTPTSGPSVTLILQRDGHPGLG